MLFALVPLAHAFPKADKTKDLVVHKVKFEELDLDAALAEVLNESLADLVICKESLQSDAAAPSISVDVQDVRLDEVLSRIFKQAGAYSWQIDEPYHVLNVFPNTTDSREQLFGVRLKRFAIRAQPTKAAIEQLVKTATSVSAASKEISINVNIVQDGAATPSKAGADKVDLTVEDKTLREALNQLAASQHATWTVLFPSGGKDQNFISVVFVKQPFRKVPKRIVDVDAARRKIGDSKLIQQLDRGDFQQLQKFAKDPRPEIRQVAVNNVVLRTAPSFSDRKLRKEFEDFFVASLGDSDASVCAQAAWALQELEKSYEKMDKPSELKVTSETKRKMAEMEQLESVDKLASFLAHTDAAVQVVVVDRIVRVLDSGTSGFTNREADALRSRVLKAFAASDSSAAKAKLASLISYLLAYDFR